MSFAIGDRNNAKIELPVVRIAPPDRRADSRAAGLRAPLQFRSRTFGSQSSPIRSSSSRFRAAEYSSSSLGGLRSVSRETTTVSLLRTSRRSVPCTTSTSSRGHRAFGFALGQTIRGWEVEPPSVPGTRVFFSDFSTTQPALRPKVFASNVYAGASAEEDELWALYTDDDALAGGFFFSANAGSLSNATSVYRFLDYAGVPIASLDWQYAFAIRTDSVETFGEGGALLDINVGASAFASFFATRPLVDIYFIADDTADLGNSTIEVTGGDFDPLGAAVYSLEGDLGKGTTLFLLRPDDGSSALGVLEFLASPPDFLPPAPAPQSESVAGTCMPVYEPPTDPADICTPGQPELHWKYCRFPPEEGSTVVQNTVKEVGPRGLRKEQRRANRYEEDGVERESEWDVQGEGSQVYAWDGVEAVHNDIRPCRTGNRQWLWGVRPDTRAALRGRHRVDDRVSQVRLPRRLCCAENVQGVQGQDGLHGLLRLGGSLH